MWLRLFIPVRLFIPNSTPKTHNNRACPQQHSSTQPLGTCRCHKRGKNRTMGFADSVGFNSRNQFEWEFNQMRYPCPICGGVHAWQERTRFWFQRIPGNSGSVELTSNRPWSRIRVLNAHFTCKGFSRAMSYNCCE